MFEYKVLRNKLNDEGLSTQRIVVGDEERWEYELPEVLNELGFAGWELVCGYRKDSMQKITTDQGIRPNPIIERELLFKREVNPVKDL